MIVIKANRLPPYSPVRHEQTGHFNEDNIMAKRKSDDEEETKVSRYAGDNGGEDDIDGDKLKGFVNAIEKINAKKDQILQDLREVYADAKAVGFDNKTIRRIVKERKMEPEKRQEQEKLHDLYKSALGMLDDE